MEVTDIQVDILRGFLAEEPDAVSRAEEQQRAGTLSALGPLIESAFGIAARRVFAPSWTMPGVIQFVARVRLENAANPVKFSALDAERELRRAFGDNVPPAGSYDAAGIARLFMLHTLVADLELNDAGLDELLAQARTEANRILAHAAP